MFLSRRKGWIGIDLGSRTIKLAQVERAGTGVRVAASAGMRRSGESGQTHHSDAQDCDWHADDILAALSLDPGFAGRRAACVLPMHVTDLHVVTVPPAGERERRAMISRELSSVLSNDQQEREFDFWETESHAGGDASQGDNVNVLSVPRELAWRTVRSLSGAGLHCEVMDGLPFALARAMDLACGPGGRAPVAAVDWGYTSGTFCVVSERRPRFTRHLRNCGFGLLVDKVSQALGLSQNEAVQALIDYGLPGPECRDEICRDMQEAIRELTVHQLSEMAEELNKTISYLMMKYPAIVPEHLCLLGEGATVRNVSTSLSEKTELPVEVWRLPFSESGGHGSPQAPTAALGAAIALSSLAWM